MEDKEQSKKDWYKTMLEMDLYHYANSEPDLDETDKMEELMNETIQRIDDNSKDLPANEKRCILCNTVAIGKTYQMGSCECNFLGFDYDYIIPKYSRYVIDLDRLNKENNNK